MFASYTKVLLIRLLSAAILSVALSTTSLAIPAGAAVAGSVTDPSGAKISGARVLLRDKAGILAYQTRSDSDGQFSFLNIAEGSYQVSVEAQGFIQPKTVLVEVRAGTREKIEVQLELAA